LNIFSAGPHLGMKNLEKLRVPMMNPLIERRLPEEADPQRGLRHISLREVLHIQILVRGVCPSVGMVLLYMTRANEIIVYYP